jgi:hypothetical protein
MKRFNSGIEFFGTHRDGDYYFADKSMLIGQMLDKDPEGVFTFLRPRRFGKTLTLHMIESFFDITCKEKTWFDDLEISKHREYDSYRNAFPVLYINLFSYSKTCDEFIESLKGKIDGIIRKHRYLMDSEKLSEEEKGLFRGLMHNPRWEYEVRHAFRNICALISKHYGRKVVVIVDDYDFDVSRIKNKRDCREVTLFIKDILMSLFNDNEYLQMGVMAGIIQLNEEDFFGGFKKMYVNNILSREFSDMFGFTDDEVKKMCEYCGHPEIADTLRDWYSHYRIGDADMYNPWDVINYINTDFTPVSFSSDNRSHRSIYSLLSIADDRILDELTVLSSHESIRMDIDSAFRTESRDKHDAILAVMAATGYLTAVPDGTEYLLSIQNKEVYGVFANVVYDWAFRHYGGICGESILVSEIIKNDIQSTEEAMDRFVRDMRYADVLDERFQFRKLILCMHFDFRGRYDIGYSFDDINRRYSIVLTDREKINPDVVIEVRRSDREHLESDAQEILSEIKENYSVHSPSGSVLYFVTTYMERGKFSEKKTYTLADSVRY